jgi:hypothetical protein
MGMVTMEIQEPSSSTATLDSRTWGHLGTETKHNNSSFIVHIQYTEAGNAIISQILCIFASSLSEMGLLRSVI